MMGFLDWQISRANETVDENAVSWNDEARVHAFLSRIVHYNQVNDEHSFNDWLGRLIVWIRIGLIRRLDIDVDRNHDDSIADDHFLERYFRLLFLIVLSKLSFISENAKLFSKKNIISSCSLSPLFAQ